MSAPKHTPGPWKNYGLYRQSDGYNGLMVGNGGMTICEVLSGTLCPPEVRDANAAFIVKAVNSYAASQQTIAQLREALEQMLTPHCDPDNPAYFDPHAARLIRQNARRALAPATPKEERT